MIKIVPFITEYLELRFKGDDKLYLVDYHRLITEKFLSQIYELLNKGKKQKPPPHFQFNPEPALAILKTKRKMIALPIDCIRWRLWRMFITRSRQQSLLDRCGFSFDGEVRISDVITGTLTFYSENEEAEAIEVSRGILTVLSPEDIESSIT